jgi:hypothetical protein
MRTPVTLDPDTDALIKRAMRERGISFKQAVNDAIRAGLTDADSREEYTFPTYDLGEPLVDLTKANQLAAELEDEELIRKLRQGK